MGLMNIFLVYSASRAYVRSSTQLDTSSHEHERMCIVAVIISMIVIITDSSGNQSIASQQLGVDYI